MRRLAGVLAVAAVMVTGCSDDGDNGEDSNPQGELAALLEQDVEFGVDTDCLADKTEELTDEQAEFLIENIDAENTDDIDADLRAWLASLLDCVDDGLASETE